MNKTAATILAGVLLTVPLTMVASATTERGNYAGGGPGSTTFYVFGPAHDEEFERGEIRIDVTGYDEATVSIDDAYNPTVKAYYSFHEGDWEGNSVFGAPWSSLGTGVFCGSDTLTIPEDAGMLRVTLNSAVALENTDACPTGIATIGQWTVNLS